VATQGNEALEEIALRIMDAYQTASGNTLKMTYYNSKTQLDKAVKSSDYIKDPICFAIGWNTYSPETKTFDIDIRVNSF